MCKYQHTIAAKIGIYCMPKWTILLLFPWIACLSLKNQPLTSYKTNNPSNIHSRGKVCRLTVNNNNGDFDKMTRKWFTTILASICCRLLFRPTHQNGFVLPRVYIFLGFWCRIAFKASMQENIFMLLTLAPVISPLFKTLYVPAFMNLHKSISLHFVWPIEKQLFESAYRIKLKRNTSSFIQTKPNCKILQSSGRKQNSLQAFLSAKFKQHFFSRQ